MVGAASCWDVEKALLFGRPVGKSVLLRPCAGGDLGGKRCCGFGAVRPKRKGVCSWFSASTASFWARRSLSCVVLRAENDDTGFRGQLARKLSQSVQRGGAIDAAGGDAGGGRRGGRECDFSASGASFGAFEVAFSVEFDAEDVGELLLGSGRPEMAAIGASDAESGVGR